MSFWYIGLLLFVGAALMIIFGSLAIHRGSFGKLTKGWGIFLVVVGVIILLCGIIPWIF